MSESIEPSLVGRVIAGKYELVAMIGGGGMGNVYRARQKNLDKDVAIKVMHPELAAEKRFKERFQREARAASKLDHPNSLRVTDYGEEAGLLYIVMEYLDGRTLLEVMEAEGPLGKTRIVDILSQALAALAVAHDQGVIHRDLKPENVMILRGKSDDGEPIDVVKVCDFGIATMVQSRGDDGGSENKKLTTHGIVLGTPEYMSPEQARGDPLDARSDLYSIGVLLYQLLAGRVPFAGETAFGVAVKHLTEPVPPPSTVAPNVDPALEGVCLRALSKSREHRSASARDMRAELRAAIGDNTPKGVAKILAPAERTIDPAAPTVPPPVLALDEVQAQPRTERRSRAPLILGVGVLVLGGGLVVLQLGKTSDARTATAQSNMQSSVQSSASNATTTLVSANATITTSNLGAVDPTAQSIPSENSTGIVGTPASTSTTVKSSAVLAATTPKPTSTAKGAPSPIVTESVTAPPIPSSTVAPPPIATTTTTSTTTTSSAPTVAPTTTTTAKPYSSDNAQVTIAEVKTTNGLSGTAVRKTISHIPFTKCYRDALKSKGSPADGSGSLFLSFDDTGHVTKAALSGVNFLPSVRACIEGASYSARVDVDTGEATATIKLQFTP